ncbi:MAG: 4-hydroxy-3-methylbut-2-enyl diphosphate reductase [Dehalococcoidales bacterium]|nr:4-hydroxy-3-methylbut-2-enyl diphosphate reductase [Dehalococcoidales bacterium]
MTRKIEKAAGIGFCFGVKRAISILEKIAHEDGGAETLGAVVHNQQVLQRLAKIGVRIADNIDDIQSNKVAISSHGVSPQLEEEIRARHIEIVNTTCPFVHRAQIAARRLAESGFFTIIYGDAKHPEVKGVLGWAENRGIATIDYQIIPKFSNLPHRLGVLSQTTQIPSHFNEFVKKIIDYALIKDSEIRIIDTICHDIRQRQSAAIDLANKVDLMLVVGGHTSANTKHLFELCSKATETHLVKAPEEIQPAWLQGHYHIGITSGASTNEQTINEVLVKLETFT